MATHNLLLPFLFVALLGLFPEVALSFTCPADQQCCPYLTGGRCKTITKSCFVCSEEQPCPLGEVCCSDGSCHGTDKGCPVFPCNEASCDVGSQCCPDGTCSKSCDDNLPCGTPSASPSPSISPSASATPSPSPSPSPTSSPSPSPTSSPSPSSPPCPFGAAGIKRRSDASPTHVGVASANVSFVVTLEAGVDPTTWVTDLFTSTTDSNLWVALDKEFLTYANAQSLVAGGKRTLTCEQWVGLCYRASIAITVIGGLTAAAGAPTIIGAVVGGAIIAEGLDLAIQCTDGAVQCATSGSKRSLPRTEPLPTATNYSVQFPYTVLVDPDLPMADITAIFNETLHFVLTGTPDSNQSSNNSTFYRALSSAVGGALVPDSVSAGSSVTLVVDTFSTSSSSTLDMGLLGFFAADRSQEMVHQ